MGTDEAKAANELENAKCELGESLERLKESQAEAAKIDAKINRIARQFLQIAKENDLSVGDMNRVLEKIKAFELVHARMVFDPEVFDIWSSPNIFATGMLFQKGMSLLD